MTLILLLMVLLVERVGLQAPKWQIATYVEHYALKFSSKVKPNDKLSLLIFCLTPAVLIGILLMILDSRLIDFIVGFFVLAASVGYYPIRSLYRQFLNAKQRGDEEAAMIIHYKMRTEPAENANVAMETQEDGEAQEADETVVLDDAKTEPTIGETLIWANLQYYAAPIFYYVIFGIPGVLVYSTILYLYNNGASEALRKGGHLSSLAQWREWLLWLPSRFVSLGYMFVGHFGNGLDAWLKLAGNLSNSSYQVVTQVALAAEGQNAKPMANNADQMVRLAKRNMVLFVVFVALLTLYGKVV